MKICKKIQLPKSHLEAENPFGLVTWPISLGRQNCVEAYSKLAEALHEGGIDGFLLETMNYWDEALIALEGLELFLRKVFNDWNLYVTCGY